MGSAVAAGLVLGFGLDRGLGDPRRGHPVAGFGTVANRLERKTYRDARWGGVLHELILVGGVAAIGVGASRVFGGRRGRGGVHGVRAGGQVLVTAAATWTVLGGTTLARTGREMADLLERGDIEGARALLPSLCGRDPELLDADGLARAALESIAENTSDATVAPLFWGAIAGVSGLLGYRAINTLDAMIGYRNERYSRFGWAAARTDDVANLGAARVAGLLTVALAPVIGGRPHDAWHAWRDDAGRHPSPNAGVAEASMAGALGVRLGGLTEYRHGVELRPTLGAGPAPRVPDLRRAVRLSEAVQLASAALAAAVAFAIG